MENDVIDTVDHIIHESGHNKLDTLNNVFHLWKPTEGRFSSPWRTDLRPMEGLLHGSYVFSLVAQAFAGVLLKDPSQVSALMPRIKEYFEQVTTALQTIAQHAELTDTGQSFFQTLREWNASTARSL
jgi:HEXXH motif-containing protein